MMDTRGIHLGAVPPPVDQARGSTGSPAGPGLSTDRRPSPPGAATSLRFDDATLDAGLTLAPGLYFGGSWVDLDGDGDLDLTIPVDSDRNGCLRVWENDGGRFVEVTEALGLGCVPFARSAAWIDLDDDGDLDLYLTRRSFAGTNLVFENQGGFLVPHAVPELETPATDVTQAWADFDGDGDLDLYLPAVIVTAQRLLLRDGPFEFRDVASTVGLDAEATAVAGAWADYDEDGDPDLAVGLATGIRLYRNEGGVRFEDVTGAATELSGFLIVPSWADADADGDLDLLAGGFFPPRLFENRHSDGEESFRDRTADWGSGFAGSTGGSWVDLDLDGDLDLLGDGGSGGPQVHRNDIPEGGQLVDVTREAGLPYTPGIGWQPIAGDFDGDGGPDFLVPHEAGRALYRNASELRGRWVQLRLVAAGGGPAVGARVRYEDGPALQVREIAFPGAGFGFASADVGLALGRRGAANRVEVRWPSGREEIFHGLAGGRLHVLREGSGSTRRPALSATPTATLEADCNPCRRAVRFTVRDADGRPAPSLLVYDARGRLVRALPAASGTASWDLRAADGRLVPAGVYWVQTARGRLGPGTRLVVLR